MKEVYPAGTENPHRHDSEVAGRLENFLRLGDHSRFIMFKINPAIMGECRRNHQAALASGFKPEIVDYSIAKEAEVFQRGRVVWGAIVKANQALYQPGTISARGCAVFSLDPYFDGFSEELLAIASSVFALRGTSPADPAMKAFAAVVMEDHATTPCQAVPRSLTNGREVRYEEVYIRRERLPSGYLLDRRIPVIADPLQSGRVMLLPLGCWSEGLTKQWKESAARKPPPLPPAGVTTLTFEQFMTNPLVLTNAVAATINRIAAEQQLKNVSLRVGMEHGLYSMDLIEDVPNPAVDFVYKSTGIRVIVDRKSARDLMGVTLDFDATPGANGFRFRQPGRA